MISLAGRPAASCAATHCAAWALSAMRRVSSASWRGSFRLSRQASGSAAPPPDPRVRPGDRRQAQQPARVLRFGRVRAKAFVFLLRLRGLHGSVDHADHALRIAPGVVAGQQVAAERLAHEGLRGLEHLGLCAAKAVDALLGVAHDEHAGRVLPPPAPA